MRMSTAFGLNSIEGLKYLTKNQKFAVCAGAAFLVTRACAAHITSAHVAFSRIRKANKALDNEYRNFEFVLE